MSCSRHAVISICYWSHVSDAFGTSVKRVCSEVQGVELVQMAALTVLLSCLHRSCVLGPVGIWMRIGRFNVELDCPVPGCIASPLCSMDMWLNDVTPF